MTRDELFEVAEKVGLGFIRHASDREIEKFESFAQLVTEAEREWVGLTHEERKLVRNSVAYNQFMTASEYAGDVQIATEAKLKEKNGC